MKRKEGKASRLVATADSSSGARAKRPKLAPPTAVAAPLQPSPTPSRPHGKDAALAALAAAPLSAPPQQPQGKGKGKEKQVDDVEGKKAVFRPVLSSPYHVAWPSLAPVHATPILHTLLALLASDEVKGILQREGKDAAKDEVAEGEAKQAASESAARRERRKKLKERLAAKKSATGKSATAKPIEPEFTSASASISPLIIGLNSITRHLEGLIRTSLQGGSSPTPAAAASGQLLLFICKGDLDPASLASHIPLLVCAYNATCSPTSAPGRSAALSLIALPANSELAISTSLAVRRCSSLLLDSSHTTLEKHAYTHALRARLEEACLAPLRAPWLEAASASALSSTAPWALPQPRPAHTAPRITHLRTSAPADMFTAKGAKKARRGERSTVRKERRDEGQREDKRGKMIRDAAKRRGRAKAGVQRRKEDRRKVESAKEAGTSKEDAAS